MRSVLTRRGRLARALTRVGLALCLVATGVTVLAAPASAAPAWTINTSPTQPGTPLASLSGVSCSGSSLCYAVGTSTFDFSAQQALIRAWNGTSWTVVPVTNPAGATSTTLEGVRCQSPTNCFVVGSYKVGSTVNPLIEQFNGTSWTVMTVQKPAGALDIDLNSVACPSPTSCFAAGSYQTINAQVTLIEHWTGTNWTVQASPNGTGSFQSQFSGLACPSVSSCFAVGEYNTSSAQKTLVDHYNGTSWTLVTSPNPGSFASLTGIACPSTTFCMAVGGSSTSSADKTLAEKMVGTTWSIVTSANVGSSSTFHGVACGSTTNCMAVGESVGTVEKTLAERWTGGAFATLTTTNPAGSQNNSLAAVACAGTAFCFAVGGSATATGLLPLAEKWNGTAWATGGMPGPTGAAYSILHNVVCPSATLCVSVGEYTSGSLVRTTSQQWNGTTWAAIPSVNPSGTISAKLEAIACPSTTNCIAVGSSATASAQKTLVEKWNGTTWSVMTSANVTGAEANELTSIVCPTATSCFAVGDSVTNGVTKSLAEHFNGSSWTVQTTPNPGSSDPVVLDSVSCQSTTSCFAVGQYNQSGLDKTLVERWNGTAWSIMASPNPVSSNAVHLTGIACPGTGSCFATGFYNAGATTNTLIEQMSGTTWTVVTSPNPGGSTDAELNGLACPTLTDCFAIGKYTAGGVSLSLVEQLISGTWTIISSPNPAPSTGAELNGVRCRGATFCMAVGDNRNMANRRTLVEEFV
jgi:hypothetical protein